jgi:peptidoglycan hydrolase CwlO-like protein
MCFGLIFIIFNSTISLADESNPISKSKSEIVIRTEILNDRLSQINSLDKSLLSIENKKELRIEVRTINKELKSINGGIYISAGAIIIILLLLIIII